MHITQNVEFLNALSKKDQLYKWIEEKRLEVFKKEGMNLYELAVRFYKKFSLIELSRYYHETSWKLHITLRYYSEAYA